MQRLLPVIRRFALPAGAVLLALLVTLWVGAWSERGAFALFLGAVAVAAYFRGVEAGLAALGMTAALLVGHHLVVGQPERWGDFGVSWLLFVILGGLACYLCHGCRLGSRITGRFEQSVAGMDDAVLLLNARGQVTFLNPAAERLTGWPKSSALLEPVERVFQPLAEDDHRPLPASAAHSLPPTAAVLVAREGVQHSIEYWGEPFALEAAPGALVVVREINERRRRERTLAETAGRFHALTTRAPVGLLVFDQAGQCVQTNPAAEKVGGFASYEAFGHGWLLFLHPDDRGIGEDWNAAVAKSAAFDKEFRFGRDKDVRWVHLRAEPVHNEKGRPLGFVASLEDVSRRRQMEAELAKRGEGENRANDLQQQLAASRKEVAELQREYERLEAERDQAEQQLRQQLSETVKNYKEAQRQLGERGKAEEALRQERDQLLKNGALSEEQRKQLDELKTANARMQEQLAERSQNEDALRQEREQHRQTGQQLEELRRQLAEVGRVRSQLEQQLAEQRRAGEGLLEEQTKIHAAQEQRQAESQRQLEALQKKYDEEHNEWQAQHAGHVEVAGRAAFLAEAGRTLTGSLDECAIQQRILKLAAPTLGDGCVFHASLADGSFHRVTPQVGGAACQTVSLPANVMGELGQLLRDGKSRAVDPLPEEWLPHAAVADDPAVQLHRDKLSALHVPLVGEGKRLGVLSLVRKTGAYSPEMIQTVEDFAQVAAQALVHARVHQELCAAYEALERQYAALVEELERLRRRPPERIIDAAPLPTNEPAGELLFRVTQLLRDALSRMWEMLQTPSGRLGENQQTLQGEIRRLALSLDGLWCVVQLARDALPLRKQPVELGELMRRGVETARCFLEPRGHRVHLDLPATAEWLAADPACLEQILVHLLDNAAKYTQAGGHIRLAAEARPGEVVLCVQDDGVGIAAEELPRLFDLNEAMRRFRAHGGEGLGIGLPLVHRLVELHGGHVEVKSGGSGQGSEVIVRLPTEGATKVRTDSAHAPVGARHLRAESAANF
jgi:PAS domain S-box-containing protein